MQFFIYQVVSELELLLNIGALYREVEPVSKSSCHFVCISSWVILTSCTIVWFGVCHPPVNCTSPEYGCIQKTQLQTLSILDNTYLSDHTLENALEKPKTKQHDTPIFFFMGSYLFNKLQMFIFCKPVHLNYAPWTILQKYNIYCMFTL